MHCHPLITKTCFLFVCLVLQENQIKKNIASTVPWLKFEFGLLCLVKTFWLRPSSVELASSSLCSRAFFCGILTSSRIPKTYQWKTLNCLDVWMGVGIFFVSCDWMVTSPGWNWKRKGFLKYSCVCVCGVLFMCVLHKRNPLNINPLTFVSMFWYDTHIPSLKKKMCVEFFLILSSKGVGWFYAVKPLDEITLSKFNTAFVFGVRISWISIKSCVVEHMGSNLQCYPSMINYPTAKLLRVAKLICHYYIRFKSKSQTCDWLCYVAKLFPFHAVFFTVFPLPHLGCEMCLFCSRVFCVS